MRNVLALALVFMLGCGGDPVDEVVGAACFDDRDCAERCETGGDFPGGFCTLSCFDDGDCTSDSICTDVEGGVCLFQCEFNSDCDFLGRAYSCRERRDTFDRRVFVCLGN
jgi:hypothetical protein